MTAGRITSSALRGEHPQGDVPDQRGGGQPGHRPPEPGAERVEQDQVDLRVREGADGDGDREQAELGPPARAARCGRRR